jgi:hypothetical protein
MVTELMGGGDVGLTLLPPRSKTVTMWASEPRRPMAWASRWMRVREVSSSPSKRTAAYSRGTAASSIWSRMRLIGLGTRSLAIMVAYYVGLEGLSTTLPVQDEEIRSTTRKIDVWMSQRGWSNMFHEDRLID